MEHRTNRQSSYHIGALVSLVAIVALAGLEVRLSADAKESADNLIRRVVAQTTRSRVAVRATRTLRAGTVNGKHLGWMEVETMMSPSDGFSWTVIEEGGSERTREKILRSLLKAESQQWREETSEEAALTPRNYSFQPLPSVRPGELRIQLIPRREDTRLVDGVLTVSPDGYPLVLEGTLAKSPSFWVKSVTIVKRYGRFAGIALPTTVESLADLKLFGQASFTMLYHYSEVDGRPVSNAFASSPVSIGPSAQILALHASAKQ